MQSSSVKLSIFSVVMMTVVSVDSIRNLPATALFGSSLVFFFVLAALLFLLPTALVSAELSSSTVTGHGGVYVWVKEAFGQRWGFLAVWLQWIENVLWYPTILAFVAGTVGYLVDPELAKHPQFLVSVILVTFWGTTLVNLLGLKQTALFSNLCSVFGLILPMVLIMAFGVAWIIGGQPVHIHLAPSDLLPRFNQGNTWVSLTGIMLSFCGMEIATVHAADVEQPRRNIPRALIYAALVILLTLMFGALAIAVVLPAHSISLVAGIMQAYDAFFQAYHVEWVLPLTALMLIVGGVGSVTNWIIAPVRGLTIAAQDGCMPAVLGRENRSGAPATILIIQAVLVTIMSLLFLLLPTVNASYWVLTAAAAQSYMVMYILMFIACLRLRRKYGPTTRLFSIPGGQFGGTVVCLLGIMGSGLTLVVSFFPPNLVGFLQGWRYGLLLFGLLVVMLAVPMLIYSMTKRSDSKRLRESE